MNTKISSSDSHHDACARVLMEDFGVPARKRREVIALVKEVYDAQRFAHCLIIMSVGGFKNPHATLHLKHFLREHGRKRPTRTKDAMLSSEDY